MKPHAQAPLISNTQSRTAFSRFAPPNLERDSGWLQPPPTVHACFESKRPRVVPETRVMREVEA